jgi:ElaB/YqjD/DUF883 family membrane-anchored ribosome-binding protein
MIDMKTTDHNITRSLDSADQAIHSAGRTLGGALDNVAPALHQTAERLSEMAQQGVDAMRNGSDELSEQARRVSYKTASYIRHDPIKSVLIAAAVGAGAMALYGLLRQDHGSSRR